MAWIHDYPRWLVGVAMLAISIVGAVGGLVVTRRWVRSRGLHELIDNGVVGWIFSATLAIYAITMGLTAVSSWSNYVAATNVASVEAGEIATLYRALGSYPQPAHDVVRDRVREYLTTILETSWPAQRRGEFPHEGTAALTAVRDALSTFEPATEGQRIVHAETLQIFDRLVEARRQRLGALGNAVPAALWGVVLVGAVLAIGGSYVLHTENVAAHAIMTALLAAMIGLLVFFIAVTDLPFRGAMGIPPTAYEIVLHDLVDGA
jgi:hypothetical protein